VSEFQSFKVKEDTKALS